MREPAWKTLKKRRRRISRALKQASRMSAGTRWARAERLLTVHVNRIDQSVYALEQWHDILVLHRGLADLYEASGQTERVEDEHKICARLAGKEPEKRLSLYGYLFYLYANDGRKETEKGNYAVSADRFAAALSLVALTGERGIPTETVLRVTIEMAESQAHAGHFALAARTLLETAEKFPDDKRPARAGHLLRAADYAWQGKDYLLNKDCLERTVSLYARTRDSNLWPFAMDAVLNMGRLWMEQAEWTSAKASFLRADRMMREKGDARDPAFVCRISMGLARCAEQESDHLAAADFYLEAGHAALSKAKKDGRSDEIATCNLESARCAVEAGLPHERAVEILTLAIDALREDAQNDGAVTSALARLYSGRGVEQFRLERTEEEYDDYCEAIRLYESVSETQTRQNALHLAGIYLNRAETAGRLYGPERTEEDFSKAEHILFLEKNKTPPTGPTILEQELYFEWGKFYEGRGEAYEDKAEEKYTLARGCAVRLLDAAGTDAPDWAIEHYVRILEWHGRLRYRKKRPAEAFADFTLAMAQLKKLPATDTTQAVLARMLQGQGDCLVSEKKFQKALSVLEQAIQIRQTLVENDFLSAEILADDCLCAGQICDELTRPEAAGAFYKKAIALYTKKETPDVLENLANAYYRLGNAQCATSGHFYTDVAQSYNRSMDTLQKLDDTSETRTMKSIVYRHRGSLFANMHEFTLAREDFGRAKRLGESGENLDLPPKMQFSFR